MERTRCVDRLDAAVEAYIMMQKYDNQGYIHMGNPTCSSLQIVFAGCKRCEYYKTCGYSNKSYRRLFTDRQLKKYMKRTDHKYETIIDMWRNKLK